MSPTISVALCTYNGARFVETQLTSILCQSYLPIEVIVSDDASSDETLEICTAVFERFQRENPQAAVELRIVRNNPGLGVVGNFQQAAMLCVGELVALCDQDDYWQPERLATVVAEFDIRPDHLLLHSDARLVDDAGEPLGYSLFDSLDMTTLERLLISTGQGFRALLGRNLVTGATTVFRRSLLDRALPFPDGWVHDEWLAIVAAATGLIDFLADELIDYRQHSGNEIGARKLNFVDKLRKLREPRIERNTHLARRAEQLLRHLEALGDLVPFDALELARGNLRHQQLRLGLPANRARRLAPVLGEALRGHYSEFGRGRIDVLRDLIQPA